MTIRELIPCIIASDKIKVLQRVYQGGEVYETEEMYDGKLSIPYGRLDEKVLYISSVPYKGGSENFDSYMLIRLEAKVDD